MLGPKSGSPVSRAKVRNIEVTIKMESGSQRTAFVVLMILQIVGPVALVAFAAAGMTPAWAAVVAAVVLVGSFVLPEVLGPPSIITGLGACIWAGVLCITQIASIYGISAALFAH